MTKLYNGPENQRSHLLQEEGNLISESASASHNATIWDLPTIPKGSLSNRYYRNFVLFVILFCIVHAAVDAVLAFSTAELGMDLGSNGSFCLYFFYTLCSFCFAKPALAFYGPKNTVAIGLAGMLIYVLAFFLAVAVAPESPLRAIFWLIGASLGGIGAGLLWTGQGAYFTTNANEYTNALERERLESSGGRDHHDQTALAGASTSSATLATFASIFAMGYLLLETILKMAATGVYLAQGKGETGSLAWKRAIFGLYTVVAFIALIAYILYIVNFKPNGRTSIDTKVEIPTVQLKASEDDEGTVEMNQLHAAVISARPLSTLPNDATGDYISEPRAGIKGLYDAVLRQYCAVGEAIWASRRLRLLLPFQVMFGFISGFLNAYINARYVAIYLGDGYIGFLSAISTIIAAIVSYIYAKISIRFEHGMYYVMLVGALSFFYGGLSVWLTSDTTIGTWNFLGLYFFVFGFGRGAWESTNKVVVAAFFKHDNQLRDASFATIYFTSGLAGAIAYLGFHRMNKGALVAINTFVPAIALLCFHLSYDDYAHELLLQRIALAEREEKMASKTDDKIEPTMQTATVDLDM